ncbi:DUF72 domain-containing protein [Oceanithermus sp.]|jgi:uncharacterized protein YecE (DUF72 family)
MEKRVLVGCSGYFYWGWRGSFYPEELPPSRWLDYYARHFQTVELNSSFYRFPTRKTVARWRKQAPAGFVYTVKAPRRITHIERFEEPASVRALYEVLGELGEHLGAVLFQMPPSLSYSDEALARVLAALDPAFDNALEFRHPSWWRSEVYRELDRAGAIFVSVSAPDLPDEYLETGGRAYLRFHGAGAWYRYEYGRGELLDWARRVRNGAAGLVYAYFNNDPNAAAPRNALAFRELLEAA